MIENYAWVDECLRQMYYGYALTVENYDEFEVVEYYKSEPIIQKDFIDPSSIVFVNQFVVQPVAKSIIAWVGLEGFKYYWEKIKVFYRKKNGKSSSQGISGP